MNTALRNDADCIVKAAIAAVMPDEAVKRALRDFTPGRGRTVLIAVGKAAWRMAKAASEVLGRIDDGVVITKYGHAQGKIGGLRCYEGGHPTPDQNGVNATKDALQTVKNLSADDNVLFLLSGGASALFEDPLLPLEEVGAVTNRLLASGADISEINTIRKRLSRVKGGRFALACAPANVYSVVLSDVLGDSPEIIASGPAYPDCSTSVYAREIARRYNLKLSKAAIKLLDTETPKQLDNTRTVITGSVRRLCEAARAECVSLGYKTIYLTDRLCCEAKDAGVFISNILKSHAGDNKSLAYIAGGETVVRVVGNGKGGRNQELALAAAPGIAGMENACVFSVGSDGTDGPTDAAGGYTDGDTYGALIKKGFDVHDVLARNDAYTALSAVGGLIVTGPTGTNVNDVAVGLLRSGV